jgi:DNA ligase-1
MTLGMMLTKVVDVEGWFASEKLDGVRTYWDGKKLWTRGGTIINAPDWLTFGLPNGMPVDGELWAGRGQFEIAKAAVQYGRWNDSITFRFFDTPSILGNWEQRMNYLLEHTILCQHYSCVPNMGEVHAEHPFENLEWKLKYVLRIGGEGLVLRAPWVTKYETGRTPNMRKVKAKHLKLLTQSIPV